MFEIALLLVIALPVAWLMSEFKGSRPIRITCGVLALSCCYGVAWIAGMVTFFEYNAWYGSASKELVDAVVREIDEGRGQAMLPQLKVLQTEFQPMYENRAGYDELVRLFIDSIEQPTSLAEPKSQVHYDNQKQPAIEGRGCELSMLAVFECTHGTRSSSSRLLERLC